MTGQPDDALEVLRGVWTAQGHSATDLDDGDVKACKRMAGVGFGVAGDDENLRSAWRSRLEREGKLSSLARQRGRPRLQPGGRLRRDLRRGPLTGPAGGEEGEAWTARHPSAS